MERGNPDESCMRWIGWGCAFAAAFRHSVVELMKEQHADFGPTLASEKLSEHQDCRVSPQTTEADMMTLRGYLARHGRVVSRCSDRYSIFRVNESQRAGELIQFARALRNVHREMLHDAREIELTCSLHAGRKLIRNLTCQFENREYQAQVRGQGITLRGARATVCKALDGSVTRLGNGRELTCRVLREGEVPAPIADEKRVQAAVERARAEPLSIPYSLPPLPPAPSGDISALR